MHLAKITFIAIILGLMISCTPEEGKGGLASIEGKIMVQNINTLFEKSGNPYPAMDENVFISYGNSGLADDNENTGYDGTFKFNHLTKGDYTIFVYSDDTASNQKDPKIVFKEDVSIESKKDEATIPQITIYKHVDYDDGNGIVSGTVQEHVYSGSIEIYNIPAQDAEVYLQFANDTAILERVRTTADGSFKITNLIPGKYKLYIYSENQLPADGDSACEKTFEITEDNLNVSVDNIDIKNYK